MHIFGNRTDVRIAVFAEGTVPPPATLKKMFSCRTVKIYKGWGPYQRELNSIYSALEARDELNGQTHQARYNVEMVVMSPGASYNVFTVASRIESLKGVFRLDTALYQRLRMLTDAASCIKRSSSLCKNFIYYAQSIDKALADTGTSDPVAQAFDDQAFLDQYGQFGKAGYRAILQLLAAEIPNITWAADVPVYVPDPADARDASDSCDQDPPAQQAA
jgi:hypothetical protein